MNRPTRRMDQKGLRILRANEYRVIRQAASSARTDAVYPPPAERGEAAPPTLIGGVNDQKIGKMDSGEREKSIAVDWLAGTIPFEKLDLLMSYLRAVTGLDPEYKNYGFHRYQASAIWEVFGIKVCWDLDEERRREHRNRIFVEVTGSGLRCFPVPSLYQFCRELSTKFWFKCTRLDLCFDDFEKIIGPEELFEYSKQDTVIGFKKVRDDFEYDTKGNFKGGTVGFGTRGKNGSGKYLKCYDKDLESEGRVNSIRWEVQFSKAKANEVFFNLAMSEDITDFATKIALFIGGSIDFIERNGRRRDPRDRLAFWEQILHHLGAAKLRGVDPDKSIETSMGWIESSVSPSLEKIRRAIGDDQYYEWLQEQLEGVKLRQSALDEIVVYQRVNGAPVASVPF